MNPAKNQNKLPPSPKSTACRKPLLNITNLLNAPQSLALKGNPKQPHHTGITRPESSKNIKPRISIDEFSRPKLKEVHSRKSQRSDSIQSVSSQQMDREGKEGKHCKNHRTRQAMHQVQFDVLEYFCFECSLVYAKQGYKIIPIMNEKAARQKQTNEYLQKCSTLRGELTNWRMESNKAVKQIYEQYGQLINSHKLKMEEEIAKIRASYQEQIKGLEEQREEKIKKFRDVDTQIEKIGKMLENTRIDIQRNYEDCIRSFNAKEFRVIMDQYWKRVNQASTYLTLNSISSLTKIEEQDQDIKMTVRTMERSDNVCKDFTFSKEKKFETPPFSKQLRGIKIVQSQPDSNRYESSLKESVVDSKINFSEFNI